ncbi:MAG: twin-arginine translocation pathway signal protein [Deltaproteobacteria bacterium]|nr:twin-arginine translocation pathway signal protein [Deltaproteobacteria bacterium]
MDSRMLLSRRGLLQAGLLGSTAIWAGGLVGCAARRVAAPAAVAPRLALSPAGEEILRAVMPVVLGDLLPADGAGRKQALDAGMASLDDYLAHLSLPLQAEALDVFETLDLLPVRVLLVGTWSGWRQTSAATVESFLRSARGSRFDLLRRMYAFLQSMSVLAWFDQRAAWPEIGYPGPPIERPAVSGGQA